MVPVLSLVYVGLAILANWLASKYLVTVPFTGGLMAPAGVWAIGAVLVIRDWLQALAGLWRSLALVAVAAVVSYVAAVALGWTDLQRVAVASLCAFAISEALEAVAFAPLRRRSLTGAVGISATLGNAVDSWIFLTIAYSSTAYFWGQFWGKTEAIAVGLILTATRRRWAPVR